MWLKVRFHHASQERGVSGDDCRHPADGRFLHRRREREIVPAHLQDELPRDRGPRAAACLPAGRAEGVFHNLVFVSIRKTYPMQAYKIMHGLWGMGQMMFTKYLVVVDDDVDVHNTSEVLFHLTANTDPQRDSIFIPQSRDPSDVLDHATSEIAVDPFSFGGNGGGEHHGGEGEFGQDFHNFNWLIVLFNGLHPLHRKRRAASYNFLLTAKNA